MNNREEFLESIPKWRLIDIRLIQPSEGLANRIRSVPKKEIFKVLVKEVIQTLKDKYIYETKYKSR